MTPEGKVKAKVKDRMAEVFGENWKGFWPVLNGMGAPALDCHGCLLGRQIIIETKRDEGDLFLDWDTQYAKATKRQQDTINEFSRAGAKCYVIDSDSSLEAMIDELVMIPCQS